LSDTYTVEVDVQFDASHCRGPAGESTALHQHRWHVSARAISTQLDRIAIVVDFRKLRAQLDDLVARVAGRVLDETPELAGTDASALAVARWLLEALRQESRGETYRIASVTVRCDDRIDFTVGDRGD
jgi:6-pyruvoyl-tetrahydropterin synthase